MKPKIVYVITRLADPNQTWGSKFALLDETNTVVIVGDSPSALASHAFDQCGADEVRHDEDLK